MVHQLTIDRLTIDAPPGWSGYEDRFRRLLEEAIQEELQQAQMTGALLKTQALQLDLPGLTEDDLYDLQATARTVARRIVQGIVGQAISG